MRKIEQISDLHPITIAGQFAEYDQFSEMTAAWDMDLRQIGRGHLNAALMQALGVSWSLGTARFDRPCYQRGAAASGMRTFAILDSNASDQEWCGRKFSPSSVAVFAGDGVFQAISQPGFDVCTLSFTDEQLALASERLGIPDVTEKLSSSATVLKIDGQRSGVLAQLVNSALQSLCKNSQTDSGWNDADHVREKISEQLVLLLTDSSHLSRTPSQRLRSMAIFRAFEVIEAGLEKGISVRAVTEATGLSRRTLEYAFRDRYDLSPKEFINSQRMVLVRRDLLSKSGTITEIANRWGYTQMGQFARDYRRQFGELPSQSRIR